MVLKTKSLTWIKIGCPAGNSTRFGTALLVLSLIFWMTLLCPGQTPEKEIVSEEEIESLLSHRDLTFGGERHPYDMKIWASPETPEGFQHLLFLVQKQEGGKPAYRLACDDLYKPSPEGDSAVVQRRDCYLDRGADGSIDEELHEVGRKAGDLEDSAFHRFIGGKDPVSSMDFIPATKNAEEGYYSILRRMAPL